MHSLLLSFRVLLASALVLLSSACAVNNKLNSTNVGMMDVSPLSRPDVELKAIAHTVFKHSGEVTALVASQFGTFQMAVSCDENKAFILYQTYPERKYPNGKALYASPQVANITLTNRLKAMPEISAACNARSDLRVFSQEEGHDLVIDINGIQRRGSEIQLWLGYDYSGFAFDPPYDAPYGMKFENYQLSCATQKSIQYAGYDIDEKSHVTDGLVSLFAEPENVSESDSTDLYKVFSYLCQNKASPETLAPFSIRKKSFPDTKTLAAIPPNVLNTIALLDLKKPAKELKGFETKGTATYKNQSSDLQEAYKFRKIPTNGIWHSTLFGNGYTAEDYSFLGLIKLSSASQYLQSRSSASSTTSDLVLEGDWKNMPIGMPIGYRIKSKNMSSMVGTFGDDWVAFTCQIDEQIKAEKLNPRLTGEAKKFSCRNPADQYKRVATNFYLVDYGIFFRQGDSKNDFFYSFNRLSKVE